MDLLYDTLVQPWSSSSELDSKKKAMVGMRGAIASRTVVIALAITPLPGSVISSVLFSAVIMVISMSFPFPVVCQVPFHALFHIPFPVLSHNVDPSLALPRIALVSSP